MLRWDGMGWNGLEAMLFFSMYMNIHMYKNDGQWRRRRADVIRISEWLKASTLVLITPCDSDVISSFHIYTNCFTNSYTLGPTVCLTAWAEIRSSTDKRRNKFVGLLIFHFTQCAMLPHKGRVSYISIYLCYFCFRWKTVSLVQASMQLLMHHVTVSLQQSKITLQNNCINNTSITQPTLSF